MASKKINYYLGKSRKSSKGQKPGGDWGEPKKSRASSSSKGKLFKIGKVVTF